jgi:hypothetical protein
MQVVRHCLGDFGKFTAVGGYFAACCQLVGDALQFSDKWLQVSVTRCVFVSSTIQLDSTILNRLRSTNSNEFPSAVVFRHVFIFGALRSYGLDFGLTCFIALSFFTVLDEMTRFAAVIASLVFAPSALPLLQLVFCASP